MRRTLALKPAVLDELNTAGMLALVFGRLIIPLFAGGAFQGYLFSGHKYNSLR
jgi:hypothetical protein